MINSILEQQLKNLPNKPGVYKFFDFSNELLYVGKAKNLKNRVRSYFNQKQSLTPSKQQMVRQINHLQYIVVNNETEALLLEANLIKQHQPPYNVVLKDDKSWLYIAINYQEEYPTVSLTRQARKKKFWYYGPFTSASSIRYSFNLFKKIFCLKTCTNPVSKPCFNARLGRCLGHGQTPAEKKYYLEQLNRFRKTLTQGTKKISQDIKLAMTKAGHEQNFEKAVKLRDQWQALNKLNNRQVIIKAKNTTADFWGINSNSTGSVIALLPVRQGSVLDPNFFWLKSTNHLSDQDKLENFLEQYYPLVTDKPRLAYTNFIFKTINLGLTFKKPQRGYNKKLINLANKAATTHLEQSLASWQRKTSTAATGLHELQKNLGLSTLPNRIEGYDISNIQGELAVGSMAVLKNGLAEPKSYRKFKIKGLKGPNDFAMLAQVLVRRLTHSHDWPIPDLIMLDGGLGQLNTVKKIFKSYNINIPLIALAKKEELIYTTRDNKPIKLARDNSGLKLLQNLRDEAHRFGITFYRKRHRQATIKSAWDELPGIGSTYKKILKKNFSNLAEVKNSSAETLINLLGATRAKKLIEYFKTEKLT